MKLAELMGIKVIKEPLGDVLGYYHELEGGRFIHLNDELDENQGNLIVANIGHHIIANPNRMIIKVKTADPQIQSELEKSIDFNVEFIERRTR